jgi:hypothetical protein
VTPDFLVVKSRGGREPRRKISRKDAKAQRFGLSETSCLDALAFGVLTELNRGLAGRLEVVSDSVDTVFQEIFAEVDQEA